jgi:hypothetical protein
MKLPYPKHSTFFMVTDSKDGIYSLHQVVNEPTAITVIRDKQKTRPTLGFVRIEASSKSDAESQAAKLQPEYHCVPSVLELDQRT